MREEPVGRRRGGEVLRRGGMPLSDLSRGGGVLTGFDSCLPLDVINVISDIVAITSRWPQSSRIVGLTNHKWFENVCSAKLAAIWCQTLPLSRGLCCVVVIPRRCREGYAAWW